MSISYVYIKLMFYGCYIFSFFERPNNDVNPVSPIIYHLKFPLNMNFVYKTNIFSKNLHTLLTETIVKLFLMSIKWYSNIILN